jgi:hypothetical protein
MRVHDTFTVDSSAEEKGVTKRTQENKRKESLAPVSMK